MPRSQKCPLLRARCVLNGALRIHSFMLSPVSRKRRQGNSVVEGVAPGAHFANTCKTSASLTAFLALNVFTTPHSYEGAGSAPRLLKTYFRNVTPNCKFPLPLRERRKRKKGKTGISGKWEKNYSSASLWLRLSCGKQAYSHMRSNSFASR